MLTWRTPFIVLFASLLPVVASAQAQTAVRPPITGIAYVAVDSADPAASDRFYRSLGYVREDDGVPMRYAINAHQWVDVVPHAPPPAGTASSRLKEVAFTTSDAAALELYLSGHGQRIAEPLRTGRFAVLDPEGNRVVFVQAGTFHESAAAREQAGRAPSHHIIHAGFTVHDPAKEDGFYRGLLGFKPYWYGGMKDGVRNFISLQVPDGTDWVEYMLLDGPRDTPAEQQRQFGVSDHFSLGVERMTDTVAKLQADGCTGADCTKTQMGRDGKVQLNVYDPDGTRVEYMEFKPTGPVCCSVFTGPHPQAEEQPAKP